MRLIFAFLTTVLNVTVCFFFLLFSHINLERLMHQHASLWQGKIFLFAEVDSEENKSWGQCRSSVKKSVVWGGCWSCPWQFVGSWADRQGWWEHLSCWWELAVTAKSGYSQGRKERKIKEAKTQGRTLLVFKTNTLQPQHGGCHCWLVYYCEIMMSEMRGKGKPDKVHQ